MVGPGHPGRRERRPRQGVEQRRLPAAGAARERDDRVVAGQAKPFARPLEHRLRVIEQRLAEAAAVVRARRRGLGALAWRARPIRTSSASASRRGDRSCSAIRCGPAEGSMLIGRPRARTRPGTAGPAATASTWPASSRTSPNRSISSSSSSPIRWRRSFLARAISASDSEFPMTEASTSLGTAPIPSLPSCGRLPRSRDERAALTGRPEHRDQRHHGHRGDVVHGSAARPPGDLRLHESHELILPCADGTRDAQRQVGGRPVKGRPAWRARRRPPRPPGPGVGPEGRLELALGTLVADPARVGGREQRGAARVVPPDARHLLGRAVRHRDDKRLQRACAAPSRAPRTWWWSRRCGPACRRAACPRRPRLPRSAALRSPLAA